MSGLFGLGGSSFFSVRESQLRPEPATWVRKAWRHHFVWPRPRAGTQQKDFTGVSIRAAGTGMGCSIISAMHHGRLGTMGSRHSSGADLLLSHYSLVIFRFLSDEALPQARPVAVSGRPPRRLKGHESA